MSNLNKIKSEYMQKYGDTWEKEYARFLGVSTNDTFDEQMKRINEAIYYGIPVSASGYGSWLDELYCKQEERMKEFYGENYHVLQYHDPGNSDIVERLLEDAVKTSKWKELPDCLQDEYHKRVGDLNDK